MAQLTVVALGPDEESCDSLKVALQDTGVTEKILRAKYPVSDDWLRDLAAFGIGAVLVVVPEGDGSAALETIARARDFLPGARLIAAGQLKDSRVIVEAMRAGASDFLEYPPKSAELASALFHKSAQRESRAKIYTFVNAKGGCGSTTIAVNTALTLTNFSDRVLLVDLAAPGNAALHLNLNPRFTIGDMYENLHRMDSVLLEQLITIHASGLHVVAGREEPDAPIPSEQFAGLFDLLAKHYEFVIVDASTRFDEATRKVCEFSEAVLMVAQTDLASIWNAQRLRKFFSCGLTSDKIKLVLNRYKKTPGLDEGQVEQASGCKIAWKFPNQFVRVTHAITTGTPVTQTDSDLSPAFSAFVQALIGRSPSKARREDKRVPAAMKNPSLD